MKNEKTVFTATILFLAVLLGGWIRLQMVMASDYPYNDGGLFYRMTSDLIRNGMHLPLYTSYNQSQIPFAYPPLAFYILALLHKVTDISLLRLFQYFPSLVSILTIPAFYCLAVRMLGDRILAAVSSLLFALVPRGFEWFVMGGGVTRSLGFLAAILAIASAWAMFAEEDNWLSVIGVALFSGATALSHPETAAFLLFVFFTLAVYLGLNKKSVLKLITAGLGAVLVVLPWFIVMMRYHGLDAFLSAGGSGHGNWFEVRNILTFQFGFENGYFLPLYTFYAILAVLRNRGKMEIFLACSVIFGYIFFPRSGINLLTIYLSLLAGLGLNAALEIAAGLNGRGKDLLTCLEQDRTAKVVFLVSIVYIFLAGYTYRYIDERPNLHLTTDIVRAYQELEDRTEKDDVILFYPVTDDNRFWWNDFIGEWFPALTDRRNASLVQGSEWIPGAFSEKEFYYLLLRTCPETGPRCVALWEKMNQTEIDFLAVETQQTTPDFIAGFVDDPNYQQVINGENLIVFKKID